MTYSEMTDELVLYALADPTRRRLLRRLRKRPMGSGRRWPSTSRYRDRRYRSTSPCSAGRGSCKAAPAGPAGSINRTSKASLRCGGYLDSMWTDVLAAYDRLLHCRNPPMTQSSTHRLLAPSP